jgi:hypothetical protein
MADIKEIITTVDSSMFWQHLKTTASKSVGASSCFS